MSSLVTVTQDYYFSSDVENGAIDVSSIGDQFSVRFSDGSVYVPLNAVNVEVSTPSASIWYNTPNVYTNSANGSLQNNRAQIISQHPTNLLVQVFEITLPKMLVSDVAQIQAIVNAQIEEQSVLSYANLPNGYPIIFSQDPATFRIKLQVKAFYLAGILWNITNQGSNICFGKLLGFLGGAYGTVNQSTDGIFVGDTAPLFNTVNSYLIHCDIIQTGILVNGISSQTVAQVPIDVQAAGFQIQYNPSIPPMAQAPHVAGARKEYVRCWLTNEKNERVDTDGQNWGFRLRLQYLIPAGSNVSKV